jgi:uncharacterized protein (TIGR02246 family)
MNALAKVAGSAWLALAVLTGPAAAGMQEDVAAAYEAWDAAFNSGDAAAVAAFYSEDAKLLPPTHAVVSGPAEIQAFFQGLFDAGVTGHALNIIEVGGGDDMLYGAAHWSAEGKGSEGAAQQLGGIATHVFERQDDGRLKLTLHTFN